MLTQLFLKLTYVGAEWVLWVLLLLEHHQHRADGRAVAVFLCAPDRWRRIGRPLGRAVAGPQSARRVAAGERHAYVCIESAVVAAGLIALRNGAACGQRSDAQREGADAAGARRQSFDPGHDRQQRAVRRAAGHGARHYQSGPRADGGCGAEQPERGHVRRVRSAGGDGRGPVRRHSGGRCLQPVSTARAEADGPGRFAGTPDSVDGNARYSSVPARRTAPATGTPTRVA